MQENNNNKENEEITSEETAENNNLISEDDITENYSFDDEEDDFAIVSEPTSDYSEPSEIVDESSNVIDEEKAALKQALTEKRQAFFKKAKIPFFMVLAVILCAFIGVFAYSVSTIDDNRVMNNVYIENLDVSNLTYEETLEAINATYLFENSQITLANGDKTFPINGIDVGLSAAPEETAKKAFNYCKTGNFIIDGLASMKLIVSKHVIIPAPQVDTERLDTKINEFGNIVLGERKQHYVELGDDGMATINSGQTGYNDDPTTARDEILSALNKEVFTGIQVTFQSAPPDDMTIETLDAIIYKDPIDARYEVNGNEVNVIPGDTGRYINKDEASPLIANIYEGCEPVKIPFYVSYPEVDSQKLHDKLFETSLASYSTSYGGSTANRCANVSRAAALINGTVIAPGEVFSFNDTVGRRTVANGFYTAKEYIDGKSVDGIGGGTCQVSSTLYSAVLYADMSIVERLNHMMTVGYIPLGQDATVSDGGVDFKFRNSSDYPIKVSAYTSGATVTVSIIGTAWEPSREVKISNSTSTVGKNTVVRSTRYVYSNGELISTDALNSSTYMPHSTD